MDGRTAIISDRRRCEDATNEGCTSTQSSRCADCPSNVSRCSTTSQSNDSRRGSHQSRGDLEGIIARTIQCDSSASKIERAGGYIDAWSYNGAIGISTGYD